MIENGIIYLLFGFFLVPIASYVTYVYTKRGMVKPIESLTASVKEIGSGNLTVLVQRDEKEDLIYDDFCVAINEMTGKLINTISKLTYSAGNIDKMAGDIYRETAELKGIALDQQEVSHDVADSVADVKRSIQEIYESIESLKMASSESIGGIAGFSDDAHMMAKNIADMKTIVERSAGRISKMTDYIVGEAKAIKSLRDHCTNAVATLENVVNDFKQVNIDNEAISLSAQKIFEGARESTSMVEETVSGIIKSRDLVKSSSKIMEEVDERSDEIGEVVEIINGITNRTKLLALNASIIAAEAGEYGKGFAVVADEIEKLSNMTTSSTSEIEEIVSRLRSWAGKGIDSMKEGLISIEESVAIAESAGASLERILESSEKAASMRAGIVGSGKELWRGATSSLDLVQTIKSMTDKLALQSQEESVGADEINGLMHDLRGLMEKVTHFAETRTASSDMISESYELINEMLHHITEASKRQYEKGEEIVAGAERITKSSNLNAQSSEKLSSLVKPLKELSSILKEEIESFKI